MPFADDYQRYINNQKRYQNYLFPFKQHLSFPLIKIENVTKDNPKSRISMSL
jgi:hypothetical protein